MPFVYFGIRSYLNEQKEFVNDLKGKIPGLEQPPTPSGLKARFLSFFAKGAGYEPIAGGPVVAIDFDDDPMLVLNDSSLDLDPRGDISGCLGNVPGVGEVPVNDSDFVFDFYSQGDPYAGFVDYDPQGDISVPGSL